MNTKSSVLSVWKEPDNSSWHTQLWKAKSWDSTKSPPRGYVCFLRRVLATTSANLLWDYVSMETIHRHSRPLTSSFIIQTGGGGCFTMWSYFLPKEEWKRYDWRHTLGAGRRQSGFPEEFHLDLLRPCSLFTPRYPRYPVLFCSWTRCFL